MQSGKQSPLPSTTQSRSNHRVRNVLPLGLALALSLLFAVSNATAAVHAKSRSHSAASTRRANAKTKSKKHSTKAVKAAIKKSSKKTSTKKDATSSTSKSSTTKSTSTETSNSTIKTAAATGTSTTASSTPSSPGSTLGPLLFNGTTLSSWWLNQSAAPTRIQLVPDPDGAGDTVQQFTTLNTDVAPLTPTLNPRSQLTGPLGVLKQGNAYWESFEVYVPTSLTLPKTGWIALGAPVWGAPWNGSPPAGISINSGAFRFQMNGDGPNPWQIAWTTPVVKGQWYRFTWHYLLSSNGWIQLYVNDVLQNLKYGKTTVQQMPIAMIDAADAKGPWGWQEQLYYQLNAFKSASVYFKGFQIGTTQAAAE
jgi:hypothetical protein